MRERCEWARQSPLEQAYHDREWGVPIHDDHRLFEFLVLEGAQAGLSWVTILRKRDNYRRAFDNFDPTKMARYDAAKVAALLGNSGIVRNRLKLEAAVKNAGAFLDLRAECGSFDEYIWGFVGGNTLQNSWQTMEQVPSGTEQSKAMSRALKKRGFRFVGPTICYAFMQAVGMVNDHTVDCYRHRELGAERTG